ncbi:MAG: magnesium transporter [Erysipelotrichaceae bacterium]|nr:magnesium transporter [Erysipelotrichaceae bacterium]
MHTEMNLEDMKQFFLESTDEEFEEKAEFIHPVDILDVLHEIEEEEIVEKILNRFSDEQVALLLEFEEDEEKYELFSLISEKRQKSIIEEMASDEIADLIEVLEDDEAQEVLEMLDSEDREEIQTLLSYEEDSAGSIMTTEFISIREHKTIIDTLHYLQTDAPDAEMAFYLYVTDKLGHLKGVVSVRDLVSMPFDTKISDITNPHVTSVHVNDDQEAVAELFAKYDYIMLPVVNDENIIVGIITIDDIVDIIKEEATEDIHRMAGLDEEEEVDGTVLDSLKSRLPWISVNMMTAILASTVVAKFSDTITAVVALAAINPIIAGLGGNAGNQSMTMIVRGLALGEIDSDNAKAIFLKEFCTGLILGLIIGSVLAVGCSIIYGNPILGIVAGGAMLSNFIIATVSGFSVPLILKKLGVDPALASSIFVTACTDTLGFFIFLGLATMFLPRLI